MWALIMNTDATHTQPYPPSGGTYSRSLAWAGREEGVNGSLLSLKEERSKSRVLSATAEMALSSGVSMNLSLKANIIDSCR